MRHATGMRSAQKVTQAFECSTSFERGDVLGESPGVREDGAPVCVQKAATDERNRTNS